MLASIKSCTDLKEKEYRVDVDDVRRKKLASCTTLQ